MLRPQSVIAVLFCSMLGCSGHPGSLARQAGTLTLHEGLPHQFYEADLLKEETQAKATIDLHGFPFYREPLALSADDADKLRAILSDAGSYRPFSGEKRCGGFHPDYAVSGTPGGRQAVWLICFHCSEVRLYKPDTTEYDLPRQAQERLERLLGTYRKNRPSTAKPAA